MATIDTSLVKTLREMTNTGFLECKKALEEVGGDLDKAIEHLRVKGLAKAITKAGREAKDGVVARLITDGGRLGVLVELNCETDFVARTDQFGQLAASIAEHVAKHAPTYLNREEVPADVLAAQSDVDAFLKANSLYDQQSSFGQGTVLEEVKGLIARISENMTLRRFVRFQTPDASSAVNGYIHAGGRIGALVEATFASPEVASSEKAQSLLYDVAMHVAASNPPYLSQTDVPADLVAKERAILLAEVAQEPKNMGKPANILEKVVEGRLGKFYEANCLLAQPFVKDPDKTVTKLLDEAGKSLGGPVKLTRYAFFRLGA